MARCCSAPTRHASLQTHTTAASAEACLPASSLLLSLHLPAAATPIYAPSACLPVLLSGQPACLACGLPCLLPLSLCSGVEASLDGSHAALTCACLAALEV